MFWGANFITGDTLNEKKPNTFIKMIIFTQLQTSQRCNIFLSAKSEKVAKIACSGGEGAGG